MSTSLYEETLKYGDEETLKCRDEEMLDYNKFDSMKSIMRVLCSSFLPLMFPIDQVALRDQM